MPEDHLLTTAEFKSILTGAMPEDAIEARLMAIAARGETVDEIVLAARALLQGASRIKAPPGAIDVCGTGGDHSGTVNVSTAVAIVVAACGVPVAKHGNRAASSRSGSADVMEALGVNLDYEPAKAERILEVTGLIFLMAPRFYPVLARLAPLRKKIARRTIFNLLGPLLNPAGVTRQLVGVYAEPLVTLMAEALRELGSERALVVHGNGLDEFSLDGENHVAELHDGQIETFVSSAKNLGFAPVDKSALAGGSAEENAKLLLDMLGGVPGPYRDIVLLNSAAALLVAEKARDMESGIRLAATAIDSGAAMRLLDRFRKCSHE